MKRILQILSVLIVIITATVMGVLSQAKFGQSPKGERLERIKNSPNYQNGEFKNLHETPVLTSDKSRFQLMLDFMLKKKVRTSPDTPFAVIKTDLKSISPEDDVLVWFGHSSYFMQLKGKTFLVDPVLSNYASPFSFINKAFKGTTLYTHNDFPQIDYLIITHDHWDHLDYKTVMDLKQKIKHVICPLGIGQYFEYWGFDTSKNTELDWYESSELNKEFRLTATPARHYSGRGLKGNQTLWASFVLKSPDHTIFIGGDSGYDTFFTEIGNKYGPFDMAILEQGQYDDNWNLIHMLPDQVFEAAKQLQSKRILPVHNSRFALANHPWDEPLNKMTENHVDSNISVITPKIGELIYLEDSTQHFSKWWKNE